MYARDYRILGSLTALGLDLKIVTVDEHTSRARMLTLVFTDLVGSTALKSSLGDHAVSNLIRRHREHVQRFAGQHGGRIIDWAGDGCFLTFDTSSAAVLFGLRLQQTHASERDLPAVRVGVHSGEVSESTVPGEDAPRIEGLAVDIAARISSLAQPLQVLMSSAVFNSVRQRLRGDEVGAEILWLAHGAYELKGFDDPLDICEAGIEGVSPLAPPAGSEKAHRAVTPTEEDTLGWRPAVGLNVPRRDHWVLEERLGEGGFGEVWLAIHKKTKAKRVFKFCFEPERVRGLKREVVLFRLLKETLGHRDDIAQIVDWEFERAPYFLESEYTEGGDLRDWAERHGGLRNIPLETRLEIVAQVAVALGAAHSVGVLHKDIKPANILISEVAGKDKPRASLTDFGIGLITDPGALAAQGITAGGLTQTLVRSSSSGSESGAGTRLYMAPELLEGKAGTTLSDIYSLGVVLYQAVIGDLAHGVAPGWERDIEDELLREDIGLCIDGDPKRRSKSADEVAARLRGLGARREELRKRRASARRRRLLTASSIVGPIVTLLILAFAFQQARLVGEANRQREAAETASAQAQTSAEEAERRREESDALREEAERGQYVANMRLAANYLSQQNVAGARSLLAAMPVTYRNWEWGHLVNRAWPPEGGEEHGLPAAQPGKSTVDLWHGASSRLVMTLTGHASGAYSVAFHPDGKRLASASADGTLRMWDLVTGTEQWRREYAAGPIAGLVVSPDGRLIASPLSENIVASWDFDSGDRVQTFTGHTDQGVPVVFSADGTRLCTVGLNPEYRVWDVSSGKSMAVRPIEGGYTFVADAYFEPGSTRVMTTEPGNRVTVWDYTTGDVIRNVVGPAAENFRSGRIDPSGQRVVSWSATLGAWSMWESESGQEINSMLPGRSQVTHPAVWAPEGTGLLTRRVEDAGLWFEAFPSEFPILARCSPSNSIKPGAFSADGGMVALPEQDGSIRIFAPTRRTATMKDTLKHGMDVIYLAAFTSDSARLITASFDGTVQIADAQSLEVVREIAAHPKEIGGMSLSPDDRYLATFGFEGRWRVWELSSGKMLFELDGRLPPNFAGGARGPATRISAGLLDKQYFSADSGRVALTTGVGEVSVLEVPSGRVLSVARNQKGWSYHNVFSPDGRYLLNSPYQEGYVTLFNADTGAVVSELLGHQGQVLHAVFSRDGNYIVTTSADRTARLWDGRTGAFLRALEGHTAVVFCTAISPDSRMIMTSSVDNTARLWNADTGGLLATMSGHAAITMGAQFSADGTRILTTSQDNVTRVWNLNGQMLAELRLGENDDLYYATWSPDGQSIVTTSNGGTVRVWRAVDWTAFGDAVALETDFESELARVRSGG